jgi:hypothetical protein
MRRERPWLRWLLAAAVLAAAPRAMSAAEGGAPASPDLDADLDAEEAWLSYVALDELARCEGGQAWPRLGQRLEAAALARLACGRLDRLGALTDLVYACRACAYLPVVEKGPGGAELARWLLAHRDVARRLFRALEDSPHRDEALGRLARLYAAGPQAVLDYPGLAVAFAATEPMQHYRQQADAADLVESFRYYTDAGQSFRCDLRVLPYELGRFLADTRAGLADRRWAVQTYRRSDPDTAYFHVEYDDAHFETGRAKRIDSVPYSLPNLRRIGGVCLDRAYYAAEVSKALGIPATIVHGRGGEGVEHAWFARCRIGRARPGAAVAATWVSRTGRYEEQLYFVGQVRNPADGRMIFDSELMLFGSAVSLPLRRREEADAATTLARLVDDRRDRTAEADLAPLHALAETYRHRCAARPGAPALKTAWVHPQRKIDLSLLEDLLSAAIARNLAHAPAWELLVKLRKADRLPVADLDRYCDTLIQQTHDRYPDYSCLLTMRIAPTIPDAADRRKVYARAMAVFGRRPDLRGRLTIALADDYLAAGQQAEALATYRQAARQSVQLAELVVKAAGRAEEILLQTHRRDEAIAMYRELFAQTHPLKLSPYFRAQTSHYQLGSRLAALLTADGKDAAARRILARISE